MAKAIQLESDDVALPPPSCSLEEASRFCRAVAHRHGANFSVGFRFLPPLKRQAVYASYAFCRWADDIADNPGENVSGRLDAWQDELDRCYAGAPSHPITVALADAIGRFPIPKSAFIALIDGCRQDLVKPRYETFEELLHYCDLVATSISDISLSIFGYRGDDTPGYGRMLSTALQLTNITRDIGDDLTRDRIYIPREELRRFGVSEADLSAGKESEEVLALIRFQLARAAGYFEKAEPLLRRLDFDARFPTVLMGGIYATVLRRIGEQPFAPLHRRVSLSTTEKIRVVLSRLIRPRFM